MKRVVMCGRSLIEVDYNDDLTRLIEHFNHYHAAAVVFIGTLEQAVNEALGATSIEDVRLTLNV